MEIQASNNIPLNHFLSSSPQVKTQAEAQDTSIGAVTEPNKAETSPESSGNGTRVDISA